jgi:hypothetical protein
MVGDGALGSGLGRFRRFHRGVRRRGGVIIRVAALDGMRWSSATPPTAVLDAFNRADRGRRGRTRCRPQPESKTLDAVLSVWGGV